MNRTLLQDLQHRTAYPSVTLILTTKPGSSMHPDDLTALLHLADLADRRLDGDVADEIRHDVMKELLERVRESAAERATKGVAVCVSPQYSATVRLGSEARSRCVIDDTFATRDMVADANRTAVYRVLTVSDRKARMLHGDRQRLVEERSEHWPLVRDEEQTIALWSRDVSHAMRREQTGRSLPTVVAGVERSVREILKHDQLRSIGAINGNHDRTGWADLHTMAWPLVADWLREDQHRAKHRLAQARGAHRYAGGIDEVWELARDGRVELLVVEESFDYPARLSDGRLLAANDPFSPDVIDDAVDELIEMVLRTGGDAVMVPDGELADHERLAAVLRY